MGKWQKKISDTQGTVPNKPKKPVLLVSKVPYPRHSQKKNTHEPDTETHRLWLVKHPDGRLVSHSFEPPVTGTEVGGWYPSAVSIEMEGEA